MSHGPSRVGRVLFPLLCALPAVAQWRQVPATSQPPIRNGHSLLPLRNGGLLLIGGQVATPTTTELLWSGTEWTQRNSPLPSRIFHASAVHAPTGDLLVFGGFGPNNLLRNDTWRFDGTTWAQLLPPQSPPGLLAPSMAYDAHTDAMVLTGLTGNTLQTWAFAGGDWELLPNATLPGATSVALAGDTVRGEAVAFAIEPTGLRVYRLQNGSWDAAAAVAGAFTNAVAAFDDARGRAVWFTHPAGQPAQTYEWDGLRLWPQASPTAPPALTSTLMAAAYDAARAEVVLVTNQGQMQVWSWAPQPAPLASSYGTPCVDPLRQLALLAGDVPQPGASHRLQVSGSGGSDLAIALLGLSHTNDGAPLPRPFPVGPVTCQQRVQILAPRFLGTGLPVSLQLTVPNAAAFLGVRYDAQVVFANANGLVDASNGLEVQIGLPVAEHVLAETFATTAQRDPLASGDAWTGGAAVPCTIGGDGRHGSFDPAIGTLVAPGHYLWNTDQMVIPAAGTRSGANETVTDGRFYFTDFVLPAGITVEFVGSQPPRLFVRGAASVAGALHCNGAPMTTFNGRGTLTAGVFVDGQPGGLPGAGGGRGGNGGNEC